MSFSAVALVTSTICWFAASRTIDSNNTLIVVHPNSLTSSFRIFEYDDDLKSGKQTDSLVLNSYDSFIASRNANLCKIIELTIKTNEINPVEQVITASLSTNTEYASNSTGEYIISPYMSNISGFTFCRLGYATGSGYTYDVAGITDTTNDDTFYRTCKSYFDNNSFTTYQFIDSSEVEANKGIENVVKNNQIVCSDIVLPANFTEVKFLVKYDYSVPLINYFYDNCAGKIDIVNDQSSVSAKLDFTSDLSEISIDIGANS